MYSLAKKNILDELILEYSEKRFELNLTTKVIYKLFIDFNLISMFNFTDQNCYEGFVIYISLVTRSL